MASKFAKLCQTSLLKNVVSKCCTPSGCSKSLRVASFHSTKVCREILQRPILPNKMWHIVTYYDILSRFLIKYFWILKTLADEVTHTGQAWSEDDTRNLRFMDREGRVKQTNTRWAMDLIAEVPPIMVDTRIVACTGGPNPALGHPKVFINLDNHDPVTCIYCGLRYCLRPGAHWKQLQ